MTGTELTIVVDGQADDILVQPFLKAVEDSLEVLRLRHSLSL